MMRLACREVIKESVDPLAKVDSIEDAGKRGSRGSGAWLFADSSF
jgi:hypothetical protein